MKRFKTYLAVFILAIQWAVHMVAAAQQPKEERVSEAKSNPVETRNKALVVSAFSAWANQTGSPYDLLADDVSWTIVGQSDAAKTYSSRAAFIDQVITPFNARMKEKLRPKIRELYAVGDAVIIFFDARGIAADGKPYSNTYAWFWKMRDGRVKEAHAFFDSVVFNDFWRRVSPTKLQTNPH